MQIHITFVRGLFNNKHSAIRTWVGKNINRFWNYGMQSFMDGGFSTANYCLHAQNSMLFCWWQMTKYRCRQIPQENMSCECIIYTEFTCPYVYLSQYHRVNYKSLVMCANNRVHYGPMIVFVCLHITLPQYHHYYDVSEGIELLKACQEHSVECMSEIK